MRTLLVKVAAAHRYTVHAYNVLVRKINIFFLYAHNRPTQFARIGFYAMRRIIINLIFKIFVTKIILY